MLYIFVSAQQIYRLFTVWEVRTEKYFPEVLGLIKNIKWNNI